MGNTNQNQSHSPKMSSSTAANTTPNSQHQPQNPSQNSNQWPPRQNLTNSGRVLRQPLSDIRASFTFLRELGRGQFGITYLIQNKATNQLFACKTISQRRLLSRDAINDVRREIQIMHHLTGNRNIVELNELYEDRNAVYLVMELCAGGELFDRILKRGFYSEKCAAEVFREVVRLICQCHCLGVMHRDLKPENFLFLTAEEESVLKATDFGLSTFFKPGDVFSELVGSAYYVAPEVLRKCYGPEADIWSAGVILYILLTGVPPFWADNEQGIFEAILRGNIDYSFDPWPSISSSAKDLVNKLLQADPKQRLTAVEFMSKQMSRILTRKLRSTPYILQGSCKFKVFRCCSSASASVSVAGDSSSTVTSTSTSSNTNSNGGSGSKNTKLLKLIKFGVFSALTAGIGTAAYATYAYTLDEVEQKYKSLCSVSSYSVGDDASSIEKLRAKAYSAAMKVPIKTVEIYLHARRALEEEIKGYVEPSAEKLLPDLLPQEQHVFTLVLDLNKTLVYSDWKRERGWRTFKRPGADAFLEHLAKFYEIVVFSDEPSAYVDTIVERLDQKGFIRYRLGRPATKYLDGKHCWDLSKLNRDPSHVIFISPRALENCLQPENSIPIKPWTLENDDTALLDLIPFLEYVALHKPADIRPVLASYQGRDIPSEFIERSKEHQRRVQEQKQHKRFW